MTSSYATLNPRKIRNLEELERVFSDMDEYRQNEKKDNVGIALLQNRQLGGTYIITYLEHAKVMMERRGCKDCSEWYLMFWPRSYFEELRSRLSA